MWTQEGVTNTGSGNARRLATLVRFLNHQRIQVSGQRCPRSMRPQKAKRMLTGLPLPIATSSTFLRSAHLPHTRDVCELL